MYLYKIMFLVCIVISSLLYVRCMFHVEELKGMNYEVDISGTPVKKEDVTQPVVFITSKNGQEFQCSLPQLDGEEATEKEVTSEKDLDVIELLKPMGSSSCLLKTKDWWTYEFCYGHYIKQYHVEDGRILGQVLTLGIYDSDYDWNNETAQEKFKHVKQKYHSQYYANGTKCDLTGEPRTAEVRFFCEEDSGDYMYRVDEPGTCSYVIMVYTSRLCSHPQLKPSPYSKVHTIACHPVLDNEQYARYLEKEKEKNERSEEFRNRWLADQQERLLVMKKDKAMADASGEKDSLEKKISNTKGPFQTKEEFLLFLLQETIKAKEKLNTSPDNQLVTVRRQVREHFEDIFDEAEDHFDSDFVKENKIRIFLTLAVVKPPLDGKTENDLLKVLEEYKAKPDDQKSGSTVTDSETKIQDAKLLSKFKSEFKVFLNQEFMKGKDKLLTSPKDNLVSVRKELRKHFEHIFEEAEEYFDPDFVRENFAAVFLPLATVRPPLDGKTEDDLLKAVEEYKSNFEKTSSESLTKTKDKLDGSKLDRLIERLERLKSAEENKVKTDLDARKIIEEKVAERLKKLGIDTAGQKVEVKIITGGYFNEGEDGAHFKPFSEEETDKFRDAIMSIMSGQQEDVQEMKRHKKLEESYGFSWSEDEETKKEED